MFKGASIKAWLDWLPEAEILALDTFQRVSPREIEALQHPRVRWFHGDSTTEKGMPLCDVIIDDGCHTHDSQCRTFQNLISRLKPGGKYFIEDVWPFDVMTDTERMHPWLSREGYSEEAWERLMDALSPYSVKRHDFRPGPDSYLIEVTL